MSQSVETVAEDQAEEAPGAVERPRLLRRLARELAVVALFAALSIFLTWPLVRHPGSVVPLDPGDSLYFTWIIGWNYHTLLTGDFANYWHPNFLHPTRYGLFFTDHQILASLIGLPVYLLSDNLLLVYNTLFMLFFALTGYTTYRLALYLAGDVAAAVFAGIAFAFSTYALDHVGHLNLLHMAWIPLAPLCLIAFVRTRKAAYAVGLALSMIANGYASVYYFLFTGLILAILFPFLLAGTGRVLDRRLWVGLLLAGAAVALTVLPMLGMYGNTKSRYGLKRDRSMILRFSAKPRSYLQGPYLRRNVAFWPRRVYIPEINLFPGLLAGALALGGLGFRRNRQALADWRRAALVVRRAARARTALTLAIGATALAGAGMLVAQAAGTYVPPRRVGYAIEVLLLLLAVAAVAQRRATGALLGQLFSGRSRRGILFLMCGAAVLLSFGPAIRTENGTIFDGPYALLYEHVPGFDSLRGIARIGLFAILGIALLAACTMADLRARLAAWPWRRRAVTAALLAGVTVESMSLPLPLVAMPPKKHFALVYHWIAEQPGTFAVVDLPIGNMWDDVRYMYFSTAHWKRLVNGHGDFFRREYMARADRMNRFPEPAALETLQALGVRYVIWHAPMIGRPAPESGGPGWRLAARIGDDYVYEIAPKNRSTNHTNPH